MVTKQPKRAKRRLTSLQLNPAASKHLAQLRQQWRVSQSKVIEIAILDMATKWDATKSQPLEVITVTRPPTLAKRRITSVRLKLAASKRLAQLCRQWGVSQSKVIEIAILDLATRSEESAMPTSS